MEFCVNLGFNSLFFQFTWEATSGDVGSIYNARLFLGIDTRLLDGTFMHLFVSGFNHRGELICCNLRSYTFNKYGRHESSPKDYWSLSFNRHQEREKPGLIWGCWSIFMGRKLKMGSRLSVHIWTLFIRLQMEPLWQEGFMSILEFSELNTELNKIVRTL